MNSRQRIQFAINHKYTDKIPVDFGATTVTGISASMVSRLRDYYRLDGKPVKVIEPYEMLGEIRDDLKNKMGIDCIALRGKKNSFGFENNKWKAWKLFDGTPVLVPGLFNTEIEKDGSIFQYPEGDINAAPSGRMPKGGYYFDAIIRQPYLDFDNLRIKDNIEEFKFISDQELKYLEKEVNYLYKNTDFAIALEFGGTSFGDLAQLPGIAMKNPKGIRDLQEWYIALIKNKYYINEIFNRQCEIALKNLQKIYQAVFNKIDVIFTSGTDFGTQTSLSISVDIFNELFKPFYKKVNEWIHKNTKWKIFIHSCGAIKPLITYFIDAGFYILNPVQLSAKGMNAVELKEKYGRDIVFWGGGVDTQKTLPFGTEEEVIKEVTERIKIFGRGGGFVFSSIHNIQAKTPIKNIISMINAVNSFRI